jgi:adenylate cyclase
MQLLKELGYDKPAPADAAPGDPRERVKLEEAAAAVRTLQTALEQNDRFLGILATRRAALRDKIAGRAVIIGWAGTGQVDFFPTPIQPACPGAVIHGMAYNAIMTGEFWRHAPRWVTFVITVLIGLSITAANGYLKPSGALGVAVLLGLVYLLLNGLLLFDYWNWCLGVAGPMVALGVVWSTGALAGFLIEAAERARITKRFSSYVDKKLVDYILERPDAKLDGQVREMSVVFTDLAGFTSMAEQLRERAVPILSDYLSAMVPVIRKHDGFVNKFLGDGIMCFFNAPYDDPNHAVGAVSACLEMQRVLAKFAGQLVEEGLPRLAMRCGVSSGNMVVGDSGPADASDYTVLGDNVNFASRLEGANKATGTNILVSQRTVELLGDKFLVRPVGKLQVVGKREGVMTYEPLAPLDEATAQQRVLCAISAEMVAAFAARDFGKCVEVADRMEREFGPSNLAALYRRTGREYLENPPGTEFAGSLILTEK